MQDFLPNEIAWFVNGYGDRALYLVAPCEYGCTGDYERLDANNERHIQHLKFIRCKYESFIKDIDNVLSNT